jgi:hypothetical protein
MSVSHFRNPDIRYAIFDILACLHNAVGYVGAAELL